MEIHDRILEAYQGKMGESFMRETHRRIHWICRQVLGNDILDVGCSQGIVPVLLGREGMHVLGVDIDPLAVDAANVFLADQPEQVREKVRFECADFMSLDLSASLYDTVILTEVLEHLVDPERFVEKAQSLLKDGGCLVVTVPFGINDFIDHKSTFYLSGPYSLLEKHFSVVRVECLGKWIGFQCIKGSVPDAISIDSGQMALIESLESAFQGIERRLVDERSRLNDDLTKANKSYRESCNEIRSLRSKVDEIDRARASEHAEQSQLRLDALHALELEKIRLEERMAMFDTMMQRESVRIEQDHSFRDKLFEKADRRVNQLEARCDELGRELRELGEQLAVTTGERDASRREVEELEARCHELGRELGEQLAVTTGERDSSRREVEELEARCDHLDRELGEQLAVTTGERDASRREVEELEARCDDLDRELCEARDHWRSELEAKDLEISGLRDSYNVAQTKRDGHYKNLMAAQNERDKLRVECDKLREQLTVAEQKRSGHYAHLQKALERYSQSEARVRDISGSIAWAVGVLFTRTRGFGSLIRNLRNLGFAIKTRRYRCNKTSIGINRSPSLTEKAKQDFERSSELPASSPDLSSSTTGSVNSVHARSEQSRKCVVRNEYKPAVMSILDEFSRECFAPLCSLIEPSPSDWGELLNKGNPKLLLVESAWQGNKSAWRYRVGTYANPPGRELPELVAECRKRGIPTVFWNKEDPVHYSNFCETARMFDYVFTSAQEKVEDYRKMGCKNVNVMTFAFQPSMHHPVGSSTRDRRLCFAGSYYANRFVERRKDQEVLLRAAIPFGLDIYDRNANREDDDEFCFPAEFRSHIRKPLPYGKMGDLYRSCRVLINVNSVVDSKTMFARRVFESLACGTPVVSNPSPGILEFFGDDVVWIVNNEREAREAYRSLMFDEREWNRRSIKGIRKVFDGHAFSDRFREMLKIVGISCEERKTPKVLVVCEVRCDADIAWAIDTFKRQRISGFHGDLALVGGRKLFDRREKDLSIHFIVDDGKVGMLDSIRNTSVFEESDFLAPIFSDGFYGQYYLNDLINAMSYTDADLVAKPQVESQRFSYDVPFDEHAFVLRRDTPIYRQVSSRRDLRSETCLFETYRAGSVFVTDPWNYCRFKGDSGTFEQNCRECEM